MPGKLKMITDMLIFGSIGLFVKNIHLSSSEIALFRGIIGSIFLFVASFVLRKKSVFIHQKRISHSLFCPVGQSVLIGFFCLKLIVTQRYPMQP